MTRLLPIEHGFTHYRLTILPVVTGLLPGRQLVEVRESDRVWLALDEAPAAGVPAPVKRLLAALRLPELFA
jgi:A/G-specific adenine glycosylase